MTQIRSLTCPHCGAAGEFLYHENQTVTWSYVIDRITVSTLRISPSGKHTPWGDRGTGTDSHIECQSCGEQFPVPTGLAISYPRRRYAR